MAPLEILDEDHLQALRRAITNCLATSIAEYTYAQILDGQPTYSVYSADHYWESDWPIVQHKELCPGFLDEAKALRSDFDVLSLNFEAQTLQAYQDTVCNSIAWRLRLIELVVTACHDIAVYLYQLDYGEHEHAEHEEWLEEQFEKYPDGRLQARLPLPPPTLFWHRSFRAWHRYPNGVAELAGYWAETQIFGGVILFDRGESGKECNGMYIHDTPRNFTIAPPTEQQFHELVDFLLSPSPDEEPCPLPITVTPENRWRWEAYEAMMSHNIFRNRHDIPMMRPKRMQRCAISEYSWPEHTDDIEMSKQEAKNAAGEPYDEASLVEAKKRRLQITPTSMLWDQCKDEIAWLEPDRKKQGRPPYFFDP